MTQPNLTYTFETPNYLGEMQRATVVARSLAVAHYKFRRAMLRDHGIKVRPDMIYLVEAEHG